MNSPNIKVSIVFPSYNGENVIENCLKSINNLTNLNEIEVVICDNNSYDSTKKIIKSFKNIKIELIEKDSNLGFAKACNICTLKAKGEFVFITNQDVSFSKDFFSILLKIYKRTKKDQEIIISPAIIFPGKIINYFGAKVHFLGFSYTPNMYKKIPREKLTFRTLKASGCSMFMKKKTFLQLNGFDNFFFMYHEDTDFSLKAIRNNVLIYTTNEIMLYHQKLHFFLNSFTYYYIERNRYICLYKNISSIKALIPYVMISELMLIFQAILTRKIKIRLKIYKFFIQNYIHIKHLRFNKFNKNTKRLKKKDLNRNLDPIIFGRILSNVKILKYFLKIINLIL